MDRELSPLSICCPTFFTAPFNKFKFYDFEFEKMGGGVYRTDVVKKVASVCQREDKSECQNDDWGNKKKTEWWNVAAYERWGK